MLKLRDILFKLSNYKLIPISPNETLCLDLSSLTNENCKKFFNYFDIKFIVKDTSDGFLAGFIEHKSNLLFIVQCHKKWLLYCSMQAA